MLERSSTVPLDASDPYAREAQTNPALSEGQLERVAAFGKEEAISSGALLYARGERGVDFFLVLSGRLDIVDIDPEGRETVLLSLDRGRFAGELDLFNERPKLVSARAHEDTRLLRVARDVFRRMVAVEPDVGELMMRAFILRRVGLIRHAQGGVELVGPCHDANTLRLTTFLTRNNYPHRLHDTETEDDAQAFIDGFSIAQHELPVVIDVGGRALKNPSNQALADALGIAESVSPDHVYDVAVVGAGPSGLAAAVYAASEGLETIVIEGTAPGGQAGTSSMIENYLGFPTGISGQALAGRAQVQAQKFGAKLLISRDVVRLVCSRGPYRLELDGGALVLARTVVVATGATYRRLSVPNCERFEGRGIHYAATAMEAQLSRGQEVVVVGGGNSAGQAAVFLAGSATHVHMLCRCGGLSETMSRYLVERIEASPVITVRPFTEIVALEGDAELRRVTWKESNSSLSETHSIGNVFVMIGAVPRTEWLAGCLALDDKGFVRTGSAVDGTPLASPFETTQNGVFAVGDVRSGSIKRVASGVGEGSVVVQAIHQFLHPTPR
jgi:thioredoxin reductase (NADPH)